MNITEILPGIHYVGVNDRTTTRFEGLWSLPQGVSYNAYLVADEKVALIDTVEEGFGSRLTENIREAIGDRKIDYLVINHMEPDHSSSVRALRMLYPDIRIVGNAKTLQMLQGFYGIDTGTLEVKEGDSISLGSKTLSFYMAPMVHWPETMVTWCAEAGTLFSGDAFGTFGAIDGGITDSQVDPSRYWDEMRRYYACIVGKYGVPVQKALAKVRGLNPTTICSTHGPVWQREIPQVMDVYDRLSRYAGEPGVVIAYGSMYGNTEQMAERIARELAAEGVRIFRAGLWKPRTKPGGFEGVGAEGVAWLRRVKRETGMYTATEVATRKHVMAALEGGIDMIWIGARTTANPFAMQEIADALRGHDIPVLVKNPVSPDLELWIGGVERIYNAGIRRLGVIHRGFTSIDKSLYRNHPMWSIPIELHRRLPGLQIFCDPSHIGGRRELIAPLSQQAMDLGFDGLIVEAHCSPDCAWSDKAQQVTPQGLAYICRSLVIREANTTTESLSELRSQIDKLDDELLELLVRRMRVSRDIGQYKKEHNMPILQAKRYEDLLARRAEQAVQLGMDREFMRSVLQAIHEESIRQQMQVLGE